MSTQKTDNDSRGNCSIITVERDDSTESRSATDLVMAGNDARDLLHDDAPAQDAGNDQIVTVRVNMLGGLAANNTTSMASPSEMVEPGTTTSTPPGDEDAPKKRGRPKKVVLEEAPRATNAKDDLVGKMLKARTAIMGKSKALTISRYEMAGYIALLYVLTKGDTTEIRQLLADAGEKWPEGNSKSPLARALVQYFMFPDEDCCSLQSRISEWARVVTVLRAQNVATPDAAREFLEANGGVRGVYANFDQEGHLKPQKVAEEGDEDEGDEEKEEDAKPDAVAYRKALTEIATATPVAKFRSARPFVVIQDGLALALVRPVEGHPKEVEVIDCLPMDVQTFQRAVIKFGQSQHQSDTKNG